MAADFLDLAFEKARKAEEAAQRDKDAQNATFPGVVGARLQTLTFGGADELTAGVRSMIGNTSYADALREERAGQAKFADEHPYLNFGAQVTGAVPHMFLGKGQGAKAVAPTIWGAAKNAAIRGGFEGAAQGFGEGEGGLVPRLMNSGVGGFLGASMGGPMEVLLHGTRLGARYLGDRFLPAFSPKAAQATAERKLNQVFERGEGGLEGATDATRTHAINLAEQGVDGLPDPRLTLGEVVPNPQVKKTMDAIVNVPSTGAGDVAAQITERQQQRMGRTREALEGTFGDQQPAFLARAASYEQRKIDADPLYQAAWGVARPLGRAEMELLERVPAEALERARKIAQAEGRRLNFNPEFDANGVMTFKKGAPPTAEDLHRIKFGLDDVIDANMTLGKPNTYASKLMDVRNQIRDRLDDVTTDQNGTSFYRQAREAWSSPSDKIDANNLGGRAHNMDAHEVRAKLAKMTQDEKDAFVTGFMGSLKDRLDKTPDGAGTNANPVRQVFATRKQRDIAETALGALGLSPDEVAARMIRLERYFNQEGGAHATEAAMLRGSPTAPRFAHALDASLPAATTLAGTYFGGLGPLLTGIGTIGAGVGGKMIGSARNENVNTAMLRMLGQTSPMHQQSVMAALAERARLDRLPPSTDTTRAVGTAGGQMGAWAGGGLLDNIYPPDDPRLRQ